MGDKKLAHTFAEDVTILQKLGIIERANIISKKINFREKADIFYRLKKLLHYDEMGSLFKVMLATKKEKNFSLGFE